MKKILVTFLISSSLFTRESSAQQVLNFSLGYGIETNWGNNGVNISAGYQKYFWRGFFLETDLRYFTTMIANVENFKGNRGFPEEQRYYNVLFLAENIGYSVGNPDRSHLNLKTGASVYYQSYKVIKTYRILMYPDGHNVLVPGTEKYHQEKNVRFGFDLGINYNILIKPGYHVGIGLDTYSREIPGEFFQTYLLFKKRL
ncbi:MAG: hypothetical protein WKF97_03355 [Chitinophagaceae bacterium]